MKPSGLLSRQVWGRADWLRPALAPLGPAPAVLVVCELRATRRTAGGTL